VFYTRKGTLGSGEPDVAKTSTRRSTSVNFDYSEKVQDLRAELERFMDEHVYPNEKTYEEQHAAFEDRWSIPPIMEELKEKASP
jgi:succinate dehydrogenase/fumarate reductase flavoprotein subunit